MQGRGGDAESRPSSPSGTPLPVAVSPVANEGNLIAIEIEADGFLYNMVRAIVGTLVEVGRGAQPVTWPAEALAAQDRQAAGPTAPPQGLFLLHVEYDESAGDGVGQGGTQQVDLNEDTFGTVQ